jgi:hypothetical protein
MSRYGKYFLQHLLWLEDSFCDYYIKSDFWAPSGDSGHRVHHIQLSRGRRILDGPVRKVGPPYNHSALAQLCIQAITSTPGWQRFLR